MKSRVVTRTWVVAAAVIVVAAACSADGGTDAVSQPEQPELSVEGDIESRSASFGDLSGPCGPDVDGVAVSVAEAEAGLGTDKLYLGVANERTSQLRPGLLKELYDAGVAFSEWCNAQGGIGGLEIGLVDLDARVLEVEIAMAKACEQTFALVGGGFAADHLVFSGREGSDFHACGQIAFPGFAISTEFAEANGVIQPIPNPASSAAAVRFKIMSEAFGDEPTKVGVVYAQLPSVESFKDKIYALVDETAGAETVPAISYDAIGSADWNLIAQQVIESGATLVEVLGEPANLALLSQKLSDQAWDGRLTSETNMYDPLLLDTAGPDAANGIVIFAGFEMYTDPQPGSAIEQMIEIVEEHGPADAKVASLTAQAFSAWLLFATAANDCARAGDGVLTRDCVMEAGLVLENWTAGGLHGMTHPGPGETDGCAMLVEVTDGEFVRSFPEIGSVDDHGDGYYCDDEMVELDYPHADGVVDPSRPY
jgi:hypothetical protein